MARNMTDQKIDQNTNDSCFWIVINSDVCDLEWKSVDKFQGPGSVTQLRIQGPKNKTWIMWACSNKQKNEQLTNCWSLLWIRSQGKSEDQGW